MYPHPFHQNHILCRSHLVGREVQHCHIPRFLLGKILGVLLSFLVGPLLGVPLGFLGALLQFLCRMMWDQGLFQEGNMGLNSCFYNHRHYHRPANRRPATLLGCHPHGGRQRNHSRW